MWETEDRTLHQIIFYVDRQGKSSLLDYIAELENSKSKDSRIKLTKIREYVKALSENGTYLPKNMPNTLTERFGNFDR